MDTLGWEDNRFRRRDGEHHTQLDLNTSDYPELDPHDVIVCGTVGELRLALDEAGLEITRLVTANYFAHGSRQNRAFRALGRAVPRSLRGGITVVARPRP